MWNKKYGDNLNILMFPSPDFGDPVDEIESFLAGFKLTKDLPLDGETGVHLMQTCDHLNAHPVFMHGKEAFLGEVSNNWSGCFLFDKEGTCVGRFDALQGSGLKEASAAVKDLCG